ncbi:LysR family transcriptional regulator [Pseudactinotalea sp.]|uniref:LysR family transcriptional regulator n=1 Tax=Pseudactinotalea sp. TaxID=1926260 RepID=UPI003B3B73AF
MDPRRVLIFRDVVRAGSISAAARELGWTQPAVSQHLRALERSVGCTLLVRTSSGVEPTEPGRVLLARADEVAAQLHMATEEMADLSTLRRGRVRLAAYPSAAATLVPAALARLRHEHPAIDVELTEAEPPQARTLLAEGAADVALVFTYDDPPTEGSEVEWQLLGEEPVLLVLPSNQEPRDTDLRALSDADWIVGCEQCRAHAISRCDAAGFTPRVRHVTDDYVVVQKLVAAGLGVTMLPRSALEAYRHPDVRILGDVGHRRYGALHHRGARSVPATAALLQELARAESERPAGAGLA